MAPGYSMRMLRGMARPYSLSLFCQDLTTDP